MPLSGNGTSPATGGLWDLGCCYLFQPRPGGNLRGSAPKLSTDSRPGTPVVDARLHFTPNPRSTPGIIRAVRLAHHVASREQTDIAFKGLQDSKEERGEPQRGPSVTTRRHRHTDARLTSSRHPPRMTQNGLPIARPTPNPSQLSCESSCRWDVSDTVLGWGSRPLVFFARYLAGRLERPAVLPCVAQTGVVSPVGGDQAPRYHPWGLL